MQACQTSVLVQKICQLLSPLQVTYHSLDHYRTTQMRREAVIAFLLSISIQLPEAKTAGCSFFNVFYESRTFQVSFVIQLKIVLLYILQIQARECVTCGRNSKLHECVSFVRKCQVKSTCTFCRWGPKMPPRHNECFDTDMVFEW